MEKERKEIGTVSFRNKTDGGDVLRIVLYKYDDKEFFVNIEKELDDEMITKVSTRLASNLESFNKLHKIISGAEDTLYGALSISTDELVDNIILTCIKESIQEFKAFAPINYYFEEGKGSIVYNGVKTNGPSAIVQGDIIIGGDDNDD
nr:MAG TPA: hypothetical protein [Caudoviricetes sp.]